MQDRAGWNENNYSDDFEPELEDWQRVEPVGEVVCKRFTLIDDSGHRRMQSWVDGELMLTAYFDAHDNPVLTIAASLNGDGLISFTRQGEDGEITDILRISAGKTDGDISVRDEVFGECSVLNARGVVVGSES